MKIAMIFGTRPEAIKMAPLYKKMKENGMDVKIIATAQHREMLDQVLELFEIKPDYDLNIMKKNQSLPELTSRLLIAIDEILKIERFDYVLVQGDTTSSFVGSLSAFYNKIPVGHVEAGLRTNNIYDPFPEEMNRRLTGVLSDLHFAPTLSNKKNLINEGVSENSIFVTGNTVIDALKTTVDKDYVFVNPMLKGLDYNNRRVILVTAHRRENLGQPLKNICFAIKNIVENYKDVEVVYPVHMNPAVRDTVYSILGAQDRVHLIDPIDVLEMHNLMNRCYLVLTDSGGLQEEAPSLGKPVLVLRSETERPEAVEYGTVKIAGTEMDRIYSLTAQLLEDKREYDRMANAVNPYGDGFASERICQSILYHFGVLKERPVEFVPEHK